MTSYKNASQADRDTLEDMIVQLYKETIESESAKKSVKLHRRASTQSPYQQSVAPHSFSMFSKTKQPTRARPSSAKPSMRNRSRSSINLGNSAAGKDDDKHSAETSSTSSSSGESKENRPATRQRNRPSSAHTRLVRDASESDSAMTSSHDVNRPLYKRQPYVITCTAYRNGSFEPGCRVVAPNIKQLLEICTQKLAMTSAARRVFLFDGSEVFRPRDVIKNCDVFVSRGEPFQDPFKAAAVTSEGEKRPRRRPTTSHKRKLRPPSHARLRQLVAKHTRRVVVLRNGDGADCHEVVLNQHNDAARFLDDCTQRLRLYSSARILYDWRGLPVVFPEVEKLEGKAFASSAAVYGPVWVSRGEGFNPSGVQQFLNNLVHSLTSQLRSAKQCRTDLNKVIEKQTQEVSNPDVLNVKKTDVNATRQLVEADIVEFRGLIRKYKERLEEINDRVYDQEGQGHSYTMKHIKEIECSDRLVGQHGLRLRIFDNGSEETSQEVYLNMRDIQRGASHADPSGASRGDLIRARFLEALTSWHKPRDPTGPARSHVIRRLFDENGDEIRDVSEIENEQSIWVSYGEEFRPFTTPVLTMRVVKVASVYVDHHQKVYHEAFNLEDLPDRSERSSQWEASRGFPELYEAIPIEEMNPVRRAEIMNSLKGKSPSAADDFLQHRADPTIVLHPHPCVEKRLEKKQLWPRESQNWLINQKGHIYSRGFPSMALSIDVNRPISVHFACGHHGNGYAVCLRKKSKDSSEQEWEFSADGNICLLRHNSTSQQVLTFLDRNKVASVQDLNTVDENGDAKRQENSENELLYTVAVMDKLAGSGLGRLQRWAVKQASLNVPGQWKHTQVSNPQWKKLAYSWPVLTDGNWNCEYEWPMEGALLPNAPPLLSNRRREQTDEQVVRLKVYKNGDANKKRFVYLVAPDLSSTSTPSSEKQGRKRGAKVVESRAKLEQKEQERKNLEQLEVDLFLERATSLLALGFAARRIFDARGKELLTLRHLKRDDVVYVSSGDAYVDPCVTKQEHQRRHVLAKLTHDVTLIDAFCRLRHPKDMVVELEQGASLGSRLILGRCCLAPDEKDRLRKEWEAERCGNEKEAGDDVMPNATDDDDMKLINFKSAHELSHHNAEKKTAPKYPWLRKSTEDFDTDAEPNKSKLLAKGGGGGSSRSSPRRSDSRQRWTLNSDGFLHPSSDPDLVLGVLGADLDSLTSSGVGGVEVALCRKSSDDPVQQWEIGDDDTIRLKCSNRLVLGASLPPLKMTSSDDCDVIGSVVTLQSLKPYKHGRAHQMFKYDRALQHIQAFQSSTTDLEVTAANHVSVCTYAVAGAEPLNQDGYVVRGDDVTCSGDDVTVVCAACAKTMRGRVEMDRAPVRWSFVCAMGEAKKRGLKQQGSFSCLNGKVDLSTYEADTTAAHWRHQLEKLRHETSLRLLNREIHAAPATIQACRVLVMRNGEGRMRQGELIVGTSVSGILEQCTQRLGLGTAARRLYTSDGQQILHMEQLIQWAVQHFHDSQNHVMPAPAKRDEHVTDADQSQAAVTHEQAQEDGNLSNEGTPDHTTSDDQLNIQDISRRLRPSTATKRQPASTAAADVKSNKSSSDQRGEIPLATVLREPVEVWVSCGENFVPPEAAERLMQASLSDQLVRNHDNLLLDTEKHVLRHMTGRRYKQMAPGELKATKSGQHPILVEGGWLEPAKQEVSKMEKVHKLEERMSESRPLRPPSKPKGVDMNRELYKQSNRKRVLVHVGGESPRRAQMIWGESVRELLADATVRLNLHPRRATRLYDDRGARVTSFEAVERDAVMCVTCGDALKGRPKQSDVRMKAKWARARKERGPEATEIQVLPPPIQPDQTGSNRLAGIAWDVEVKSES